MANETPIWRPDPGLAGKSQLARFIDGLRASGASLPSSHDAAAFDAVHRWSIAHPAEFWSAVWRDADVVADVRPDGTAWETAVIGSARMAPPDPLLGPRWFPGARLNFAENLLRHDGPDDAIIAWDESGRAASRSWSDLRREVGALAAALHAMDVKPGDRVAGWLPNIPEAVVAMLATTTLGAVWTSCSPDFGVDGVVDRFGQTRPTVLFFCDGYRYAGKLIDCTERAGELLQRLPSVRHAVMIDCVRAGKFPTSRTTHRWEELAHCTAPPPPFARLPFDHPLCILYSSGTTGLPKCLVHSAGGTLLQHLKEHRLHVDLRRGDRLFYFTTCGWMMWNWQVSALASDATLVLYDGAPLPAAEPDVLWRMAAAERVSVFGTSAKYLGLAEKHQLEPARRHDLPALRSILSTGSPLAPESFDWIRAEIGASIQPASISGGTDIVSCFMLGNPFSPIYRGEIAGPGLGMAVDVFDESGTSCRPGEPGELVCTRPFPAMPIEFWSDPDGGKYRAAYFETFPGAWRHGDWVVRTIHGGFVISGRSDATLNPGGVRIGTAEIYRQVEAIHEVLESLVVGQRVPGAPEGDQRVVLFVRLRDGVTLTDALRTEIRQRIRVGASPHHVPRVIVQVPDLPRTRSGKLSELAVRDMIEGHPVKNAGALANPEALDAFRNRPELGVIFEQQEISRPGGSG